MRSVRLVWWYAIVALGTAVFCPDAAAQFGGGKPVDEAERKAAETFDAAALKGASVSPPATPCQCLGESDAAAIAQINQALAQPLKSPGLDFTEQPLEDVVAFLREEYGLPLQLDVPALEDNGLTPDEPTTCTLQEISLKSALRLLLKQHQLTYIIQDEVLVVTSPEVAEKSLVTCVYDVRDLVTDGRSFRALAEAVTSCIGPGTWAKAGGGEAELRPVQPGLLVVSQTQGVHEEIGELLSAIRKMRQGTDGSSTGMEGGMDAGGEFGAPAEEP